jgi:3-oxoacid CoA-transferase B subunit
MNDVQRAIAARVAPHIPAGAIVNLGIGIPTLVADLLPPGWAHLQIENGMLGAGPRPAPDAVDPDLIDAGKMPITAVPGASYVASSAAFGMIRGGHVELAVLGALQVDAAGRIANWAIPGKPVLGVGGAMDLMVGARRVIVATTHTAKDGAPKIVAECTFPLTAIRSVDLVITEAATFALRDGGLVLTALTDGVTLEWVRKNTAAAFAVDVAVD